MEIKRILGEHLEANVFVVKTGNNCIIIDSGAKLGEVKKAVGKNNVLGVFLTHGHFDHATYAIEYAKEFSCKIYAHEEAKAELEDPAKNYGESFKIDTFENFLFLNGDGKLKLGDIEIEYFYTPGHCESCVCFLINSQLFAGDTLFDNGIGRTDLIGSSKEEMLSSLEKLEKLIFSTCHRGHGESSDFDRQKRNIKIFQRFLTR